MEKPPLPEAAGLPCLAVLITATDPGDTDEILLPENGVVVGQESGTLPLRERRGEQGVGGVDAAIQAEADRCGAGVVGVLDELLHDRRPLRVVHQHLADPPSQVNLLAEVFQKDRHRVRRRPRR